MAAKNRLKLSVWHRSVWRDLWDDGSEGHCDKDGEFPRDSNVMIWVLLKNGVELSGRLSVLMEAGGIWIDRKGKKPDNLEFNVREVAAYSIWDASIKRK